MGQRPGVFRPFDRLGVHVVVQPLLSRETELIEARIETDGDPRGASPIPIRHESPGRPSPSPPHFNQRVNLQIERSRETRARLTRTQRDKTLAVCGWNSPAFGRPLRVGVEGSGAHHRTTAAPSSGCPSRCPPLEAGAAERRQEGSTASRPPGGSQ